MAKSRKRTVPLFEVMQQTGALKKHAVTSERRAEARAQRPIDPPKPPKESWFAGFAKKKDAAPAVEGAKPTRVADPPRPARPAADSMAALRAELAAAREPEPVPPPSPAPEPVYAEAAPDPIPPPVRRVKPPKPPREGPSVGERVSKIAHAVLARVESAVTPRPRDPTRRFVAQGDPWWKRLAALRPDGRQLAVGGAVVATALLLGALALTLLPDRGPRATLAYGEDGRAIRPDVLDVDPAAPVDPNAQAEIADARADVESPLAREAREQQASAQLERSTRRELTETPPAPPARTPRRGTEANRPLSAGAARTAGLNYVIVQGFAPEEADQAAAVVEVLGQYSIGATIEDGLKGYEGRLVIVGTEGFERISSNAALDFYLDALQHLYDEEKGKTLRRKFDALPYKWGQ